ncbi:uncharacterized protein LOC143900272 isoform X2 [Temnothorax americanus]|uniref:uncharacterized protein LOC143900272 isoform X2 n=1 Tax=Temnothorax americanus TaxID=1964332 RepID=UPI0040675FFC
MGDVDLQFTSGLPKATTTTTTPTLRGAASSATSLEYKIVFEMLGVLLLLLLRLLPLLPSVVAGNPG